MNWPSLIIGAVLEVAALIVAVRLWHQKQRGKVSKLFWTFVLLIPFFGLLIYGFLTVNPDSQSNHNENAMGVEE